MGVTTWVRLPRDQWPASWHKMRDPVCPLKLALYGHPDSGSCWEVWCEEALRRVGFENIPGRAGCFAHKTLGLVLSMYVDAFKLSGPVANVDKGWKLIQKGIGLEPPTPMERYLGCVQHEFTARVNLELAPGYGVAGGPTRSGPEGGAENTKGAAKKGNGLAEHAVRGMECGLTPFVQQCVQAYQDLVGPKCPALRKVGTPFVRDDAEIDDASEEGQAEGQLAPIALKVLLGWRPLLGRDMQVIRRASHARIC